jgi:hypothetical protein
MLPGCRHQKKCLIRGRVKSSEKTDIEYSFRRIIDCVQEMLDQGETQSSRLTHLRPSLVSPHPCNKPAIIAKFYMVSETKPNPLIPTYPPHPKF